MIRPRVIPCLLLRNAGLVKTVRFRDPTYLGDPINIVRLFNDKEADELIFLDIEATPGNRPPPFELLGALATECFMPLCYGGGIRSVDEMRRLFSLGIEKVALNTSAVETPDLVRQAADLFGSQSLVAAIDSKKKWRGGYEAMTQGGRKGTGRDPADLARDLERAGAGEILLTSIDRDGTREGYDLDLIRRVTSAVGLPVVACGGADRLEDLAAAIGEGGASAAAAGSLFVFQGRRRAVLISYPDADEIARLPGGPA